MATVLKNDIHTNIAQIVYNGVRSRTARVYFALGKILPWEGGDTQAPIPTAARDDEFDTRSAIVGMRSATISDVSYSIDRTDWESGTVYDMYDDRYSADFPAPSGAEDIADANMFVITDDFNIYKCISNNYNGVSTVKPTGTSTGYIGPLSDGYVWKYMDTVDSIQRSKYLTNEFIPVSNSVEDRYFESGLGFTIVNPGSGYDPDNIIMQVIGDSTGAIFRPEVDQNGQISNIVVENPGSGYSFADVQITKADPPGEEYVVGQDGFQEHAEIIVNVDLGELSTPRADVQLSAVDGEISFVYVTEGGSGYTNASVTIDGNGINADAQAVISNGQIVGITLLNRGESYTSATVTITGDGTGAAADAIIAPVGGHGRDIISESFADVLCFQSSTVDEVNQGFILNNDYRQISIILDPDQYPEAGALRQRFLADYGSTCWVIDIDGQSSTSYSLDQKIINQETSDELFVVAVKDITGGTSLLVQSIDGYIPEVGDTFIDDQGNPLFTVAVGSLTPPQVDKFSGSMISINNRPPFRRDIEQIVNFRTFIRF